MQRHRHDDVCGYVLLRAEVGQEIAKRLGDAPLSAKLEREDCLPRRTLIDDGGAHTGEGSRAATMRAHRACRGRGYAIMAAARAKRRLRRPKAGAALRAEH